jgi:protein-tyrosine phosphatase
MIDGDNPEYIHDSMIDAALSFMKEKLDMDEEVFIYCSLGESRSPSIALMYLLENELINRDVESCRKFQKEYPKYKPNTGVFLYLKNRYKI